MSTQKGSHTKMASTAAKQQLLSVMWGLTETKTAKQTRKRKAGNKQKKTKQPMPPLTTAPANTQDSTTFPKKYFKQHTRKRADGGTLFKPHQLAKPQFEYRQKLQQIEERERKEKQKHKAKQQAPKDSSKYCAPPGNYGRTWHDPKYKRSSAKNGTEDVKKKQAYIKADQRKKLNTKHGSMFENATIDFSNHSGHSKSSKGKDINKQEMRCFHKSKGKGKRGLPVEGDMEFDWMKGETYDEPPSAKRQKIGYKQNKQTKANNKSQK